MNDRIYLSAPDVRGLEVERVVAAIESNWLAPIGPDLNRFEEELAECGGRAHCVALSSGTAALQLAMIASGIGPGDTVVCSTLTFVATANAIHHAGAIPIFVDSSSGGFNIDPNLLDECLARLAEEQRPAKAVVAVDLYGYPADYTSLAQICHDHGATLIEDAAEAMGASHQGRPCGSFGAAAAFSFNGNKMITASGGGALLTDDASVADHVRHLATQAREDAPHYEHVERGYNFRMSNVLAALGSAQLATLPARIERRTQFAAAYREATSDLPVAFVDPAPGDVPNHWLTCMVLSEDSPVSPSELRVALERQNIEARPIWKPMHQQPAYEGSQAVLNGVSDKLFDRGICLPSGSGMTDHDFERVLETLIGEFR